MTRPPQRCRAPPLKRVGTHVPHGDTALRNGNPKSMGHGLTLTYIKTRLIVTLLHYHPQTCWYFPGLLFDVH